MNLLVSLKHYFDSRSALLLLATFTFSTVVSAQLDIRVADPASLISAQPSQINYVAQIGRCSDLVSVQVGVDGAAQSVDLEELVALPEQGDACLAYFPSGMSAGESPSVQVRRRNDDQESLTEQFQPDNKLPAIEFDQAAIVGETGSQRLAVTVSADDDTDITHLSFDVVGLRASDLSTTGGVIFEAKQRAFASTDVSARVYPDTEGQNQYTLSLPITGQLSNEEIAFDVVVLVDVSVVDASGNQRAISKVAFTGDSIQEEARALVLQTQEINIGDRLQRPVIIPSVDFQFRGLVALPGAGNGVSYQSSHPNLITVTAAGTVYAPEETGSENVFITVTYPGLPSAQVSVVADFTRELAGQIGSDHTSLCAGVDGQFANSLLACTANRGIVEKSLRFN